MPISFSRCTLLHLNEQDFLRTGKYLDLMWEVLHKETFSMTTIEFLQSALFNDLKHIQQQSDKQSTQQLSRSEQIMQRFLDLVAEFGATQRNVKFYAEQLLLTPNHLSAVVRQQSGQTVMQWLNERTILQAKVLLKHSDLSNSEIAFQLGFNEATLFSRFFRRETGMTPKKYRTL
ncbi:MAG: AraC family transcriptional regulator [Paludibacteraceae bacterium]|nr:AraC family transcriptional regulator [Paludibacteraceae bacterium]